MKDRVSVPIWAEYSNPLSTQNFAAEMKGWDQALRTLCSCVTCNNLHMHQSFSRNSTMAKLEVFSPAQLQPNL